MHKKLIYLFIVSILFGSCDSDYLDITPTDRIVSTAVWSDANLVELYVNRLYQGIPHGFERHMWSKYTDEAYGDNTWLMGTWNPDNITGFGQNSNWIDYYERGYQFIRQANIFLEEIETSSVSSTHLSYSAGFFKTTLSFFTLSIVHFQSSSANSFCASSVIL